MNVRLTCAGVLSPLVIVSVTFPVDPGNSRLLLVELAKLYATPIEKV